MRAFFVYSACKIHETFIQKQGGALAIFFFGFSDWPPQCKKLSDFLFFVNFESIMGVPRPPGPPRDGKMRASGAQPAPEVIFYRFWMDFGVPLGPHFRHFFARSGPFFRPVFQEAFLSDF